MVQVIEELKLVEVGTVGDLRESAMLRVHAYQGVNSGKFYGIIVDDCKSGGDRKARKIMFGDIDRLEKITADLSNKCDEVY